MSRQSVRNWIAEAKANGISHFFAADFALVKTSNNTIRHNRLGAIPRDMSKEGAGVGVYAFGFDELGHCVALCRDGLVRQFLS
jgi:hypothetical protein